MKQKNLKRALVATLISSGAIMATPASAAGYCSSGTATENISTANVTFAGASANDCYGVISGNITGKNGSTILNAMNWGTGWSYLDATDASSATYMGLKFNVTATPGTTGSWTLSGIDTNGSAPLSFPATLDFAIGLKAGNEYALWGFDNVVASMTNKGSFSIVFTNGGGNNPDLSHLIIFGREGSGGSVVAAIPEAKTYAMMLAGLGLVGFATRRRMS